MMHTMHGGWKRILFSILLHKCLLILMTICRPKVTPTFASIRKALYGYKNKISWQQIEITSLIQQWNWNSFTLTCAGFCEARSIILRLFWLLIPCYHVVAVIVVVISRMEAIWSIFVPMFMQSQFWWLLCMYRGLQRTSYLIWWMCCLCWCNPILWQSVK